MNAYIFYDTNLRAVQERFPNISERVVKAGAIEPGQGIAVKNAAGDTGIYFNSDEEGRYKNLINMLRKCFDKGFRNFFVLYDDSYNEAALNGIASLMSTHQGETITVN